MKRKYFFVILFLVLAIFLSGCSGVTTPSINLTGNWTMTNGSDTGQVTTSKCSIVDNNGSLTIYNYYIVGQSIDWNTGYGTFDNSTITGNVSGSYLNIYGSIVSLVIYFEGTINASGISGSGTWIQTSSVSGYIYSTSGNTIFIKG
jgi:uncharacterized protein YceK